MDEPQRGMICTRLFTVHSRVTLWALPSLSQAWHISISPRGAGVLICRPPRTIKPPVAAKRNRHPWCADKIRWECVYDLSLQGAFAGPCDLSPWLHLDLDNRNRQDTSRSCLDPLEAGWCLEDRLPVRRCPGATVKKDTVTLCPNLRIWPDGERNECTEITGVLTMGLMFEVWSYLDIPF